MNMFNMNYSLGHHLEAGLSFDPSVHHIASLYEYEFHYYYYYLRKISHVPSRTASALTFATNDLC